jgi:SAM-dependent methyltransferase
MWDARYEAADLVWGLGPNVFLPPLVADLVPGSALDLACGEGRNAIWLAANGWDVTAVDFSPVGIDKARTLAGDVSVRWVVDDVTTYQADRSFDLVLIYYLHLPEAALANAFARAVEALAPGGQLFGVGHALANLEHGYGGPPVPEILWTESGIESLVGGLEVIELGERTRDVPAAGATAIDLVVHARRPTHEASRTTKTTPADR